MSLRCVLQLQSCARVCFSDDSHPSIAHCGQAADEVWSGQLADLVINQLPVHAGKSEPARTINDFAPHFEKTDRWLCGMRVYACSYFSTVDAPPFRYASKLLWHAELADANTVRLSTASLSGFVCAAD